jgi:hypothetical protein
MMQRLRKVLAIITLGSALVAAPALAQPYDPETCRDGYVWRDAFPGDHVCVTPQTRTQTAQDNSQANARRQPGGAYGPDTCRPGYVWREARPEDHVCVTPETRAAVASDNSEAAARRARPPQIATPSPPAGRGETTPGPATPLPTASPAGSQSSGASPPAAASFWTTLPGMLTGLAGLIGAIAALATALRRRQ